MPLSQVPSKIVEDPRKYMTYWYARPGAGKTSLAAQIPAAHFILTEAGTSGVSVYGDSTTSWQQSLALFADAAEAKLAGFPGMRPIEVLVIDNYDNLWDQAASHVMDTETFIVKGKPEKFIKVADVEYGKAFARVNEVVLEKLNKLKSLGFGIVLTGHAKEKKIKWRGQDYDRVGLDASESVERAIVGACDAVGYMVTEETVEKDSQGQLVRVLGEHRIYWQPTMLREGKHRLKGFPEYTQNPLGSGWEKYVEAFNETLERGKGGADARTGQ